MRARAGVVVLCWLAPTLLCADAVPGGLYAYGPVPPASEVRFENRRVLVIDETALVGIPLSAAPGTHSLTIAGATGETFSHPFEVVAKQYPEQRLTIANRKMVNPDPEDLERIRSESARMREQYLSYTEALQRLRPFLKPVNGVTSSPFGRRRILNDQPRSPPAYHPIASPASHNPALPSYQPARPSLPSSPAEEVEELIASAPRSCNGAGSREPSLRRRLFVEWK